LLPLRSGRDPRPITLDRLNAGDLHGAGILCPNPAIVKRVHAERRHAGLWARLQLAASTQTKSSAPAWIRNLSNRLPKA